MIQDEHFDLVLFDACDLLVDVLIEQLGAQITDTPARTDLVDQALARASDIVHASIRAYASSIRVQSGG